MVRNAWSSAAEMHQTADTMDVADVIQAIFQLATYKNVARKNRFDNIHRATARRAFQSQPGVEDLQSKSFDDVSRGYMLTLGLRPSTIPLRAMDLKLCRSASH